MYRIYWKILPVAHLWNKKLLLYCKISSWVGVFWVFQKFCLSFHENSLEFWVFSGLSFFQNVQKKALTKSKSDQNLYRLFRHILISLRVLYTGPEQPTCEACGTKKIVLMTLPIILNSALATRTTGTRTTCQWWRRQWGTSRPKLRRPLIGSTTQREWSGPWGRRL